MSALQKVLYVEDDVDIRDIATIALQDIGGLTVNVCESGAQALQTIDDFAPQLLLLDVMMPDMDGPETLVALRQQGSVSDATMVVFMTAKVHPEEIERYHALGATHVISKPFDPMTLAEELRSLWETFA